MRIPIQKEPYHNANRYIIRSFVAITQSPIPIEFILDTGCDLGVVIMEADIRPHRIPYTSFPRIKGKEGKLSIAGELVDLYNAGKRVMFLKDEDGKVKKLEYNINIGILANRKLADKVALPSIIGLGFLDDNNYGISIKDSKGIRYLQD